MYLCGLFFAGNHCTPLKMHGISPFGRNDIKRFSEKIYTLLLNNLYFSGRIKKIMNKRAFILVLVTVLLIIFPGFIAEVFSAGSPPPPPGGGGPPPCWPPPCIPIDGGIVFLATAATAFGAKKLFGSKKVS